MRKLIAFLLVLTVSTIASAGSVNTPNTFVAGTTAKASEVNANFSAVETAVNDNDTRITSNSTAIGSNSFNIANNTSVTAVNSSSIATNTNNIATHSTDIADLTDRSWEKLGNDLFYNDGNVGIGTTNPDLRLTTNGDVRIGEKGSVTVGGVANSGKALVFSGATGLHGAFDGDNSDPMWIERHNSANDVSELRVIIGDNSKGSLATAPDMFVIGTCFDGSGVFNPSCTSVSGAWNPQFTVQSDGNVGIGTTGPNAPLSLGLNQLNFDAFDTNANYDFADPHSEPSTVKGLGSIVIDFDNNANSTTQIFAISHDDGIEVFRIEDNGNVGIGTTNPQGTLDVNGSIFQRGGQLHADYVFDSEYRLESIEEHSEYMWNKKHLKAVPKAKLDKKGREVLEVGAHRRGILEELEKAHIYIEQLHKHMKVMEDRLAKLESRPSSQGLRAEISQ